MRLAKGLPSAAVYWHGGFRIGITHCGKNDVYMHYQRMRALRIGRIQTDHAFSERCHCQAPQGCVIAFHTTMSRDVTQRRKN